jgi:RNA polymerase sigma-70 factor (ECF subfamily)
VQQDDVYGDRGDGLLMAAWQDGDAAAFAALVRRWQGPMARFIARMLGPVAQVDDVCQDVFLRMFEAGRRYREQGAFSTWLYRIALNVTRDAMRKKRSPALNLVRPPALAPSADSECERRETSDLVTAAIAELPEPLRLVLVLHHYEGLNFEQMSALTKTPASTLKSRFAAALSRLRSRLQRLNCDLEESIK